MKDNNDIKLIEGAGGGGSSRSPVEAPNTLQSRATLKVQEILSEGEVEGLLTSDPLKSIFLDGTAIRSADGQNNFPAAKVSFRHGTEDQDYIEGFAGVEQSLVVNTELEPDVIRTVSDTTVDAVRVAVRLPQGLFKQDTKNGDTNGYRVGVAIDVRPTAGGTWTNAFSKTIAGKTMTPYEESYRVEKPQGITGSWDVRVRRTTQKSTVSSTQDTIHWWLMTEIQDVKVNYPGAAVVGIALDSEATGGQIPTRSYLMKGIICKVPTNYTPTVYNEDGTAASYASYSGNWNGTFKLSWTDCPQWILYDVMTNTKHGYGQYINEADIDIYEVYENSRYCAELIPKSIEEPSVLTPRFTFDGLLQAREDAFRVIQTVAAASRTVVFSSPGTIRFIMERPKPSSAKINNTNVVDGTFNYSGTAMEVRTTSVDVSFNDRENRYNARTINEEADPSIISKWGYNKLELAPVGVVREEQARRLAKWVLDSAINAYDAVTFRISWMNAFMQVGDIVEVSDEFYAAEKFSGRLVSRPSGTANQIRFDQPLTLTSGTVIKYMTFDGIEQTRSIANSGTNQTDYNLTSTPGALNPNDYDGVPYVVLEDVSPRLFTVSAVSEPEPGMYDVTGIFYDPNRFARIEQGISIAPPLYSNIEASSISTPTNVVSAVETHLDQGIVNYSLRLDWDDVNDPYFKSYRVQYRRDNGQYHWTGDLTQSEVTLENILPGIYEFNIYAYNIMGVQSAALSGWTEVSERPEEVSPLTSPSGLRLMGTNVGDPDSNTFNNTTFTLVWNAPAESDDAFLRDYQVNIHEGANLSSPVIHSFLVPEPSATITKEDVKGWFGVRQPPRSIFISVRSRDTLNRVSLPESETFTNPAPPPPSVVNLNAFFSLYELNYPIQSGDDLEGVKIHHATTNGFTPNNSNLALKESADQVTHLINAEEDTTYYVRVGFYDTWSEDELTYSNQYTVTTQSTNVGIDPIAPTGLSASSSIIETAPGVQQAKVTLTWTRSTNASSYDLEILAPSIGYAEYPQVSQPDSGLVSYSFITATTVPFQFRIRSRAANSVSVWSDVVNHTTVGDTIAPDTPTAFTVTAGYQSAVLKWTNPTANDLSAIIIYRRRTTAPTQSEQEIARYTVTPSGSGSYFDMNLTAGATYQYRIEAIDRSGNTSGYTALRSVVPVEVDIPPGSIGPTEIADNAVSIAKMANGLQPIEIVSSLPTSGNYVGRTVYLTTDGKLYRRTSNAWTAAVPTTDLTGQITGVQITDNAVTAEKIAGNTITANEINANSIRSAVLITDSITSGMIQAGAVRAQEIAAGAITASKMAIATTENLIPDATFSNNAGEWNQLGSTSSATQFNGANGMGVQIAKSAATSNAQLTQPGYSSTTTIPPNAIKVEAGAEYRVKGTLWTTISGGAKGLSVRYWTSAGTSGTTTVSSVAAGNIGTSSLDTIWTIPSNYVAVQFFLNAGSGAGTGTTRITNLSVTRMAGGELIVDGAITAVKIAANTITSNEINTNSIKTAILTANSITTNMIGAYQVTAAKIAGNTITADQIASNTITSNEINTNSIRTAILVTNSIKTNMIEAGAVTATKISSYSLTASNASIANGMILNAMIKDGTIETAKIANAAITNAKIGGDIWSSNWANNLTGWRIYQNGNFQLNGSTGSGRTVMNGSSIQMYDSSSLKIKIAIS